MVPAKSPRSTGGKTSAWASRLAFKTTSLLAKGGNDLSPIFKLPLVVENVAFGIGGVTLNAHAVEGAQETVVVQVNWPERV